MQDHRVDWVRLLQLKQELLHRLDGVVATHVDHHFLDLKRHIHVNSFTEEYFSIYGTLNMTFTLFGNHSKEISKEYFESREEWDVYILHLHKATVWYHC